MESRQSDLFDRRVKRRVAALAAFAACAALLFLCTRVSSTAFEPEPQQRRRPTQGGRRRPAQPTTGTPGQPAAAASARGGSRFKHQDHRPPVAKLDCNDCHIINAPDRPDDVAAATKPGAKGYPYHDSCVRCHRADFFRGASPPICTVCHTRSTPRLTARDMQPFPKESAKAIAREFPGYFPHSLHQSLIARADGAPSGEGLWRFERASFTRPDDPQPKFAENCATCHETDARPSMPINVGGTEGTFKPELKGMFKTVPDGHASCFNCHWQSQKPTREDCAGCHLSQGEFAKKKRAASIDAALPGVLSPMAAQWFKTWPRDWPKRLSIKFSHETPTDHDVGCTTCHINITRMETLNIPKADVPIGTCARCHVDANSVGPKGGEKITIRSEMTKEAEDKENKTNTCSGCHTSQIGRERPPCSHYVVIGQQCKP